MIEIWKLNTIWLNRFNSWELQKIFLHLYFLMYTLFLHVFFCLIITKQPLGPRSSLGLMLRELRESNDCESLSPFLWSVKAHTSSSWALVLTFLLNLISFYSFILAVVPAMVNHFRVPEYVKLFYTSVYLFMHVFIHSFTATYMLSNGSTSSHPTSSLFTVQTGRCVSVW